MHYRKHVEYHFEVDDKIWAVTGFNDTSISFEETRKNGQEDTHVYGEAMLVDGKWVLDYHTKCMLKEYWGNNTINEIEDFFNKHGPPTDE